MKPTYTESWRNCRELARHMWRFYCLNRSPPVSEMSQASYKAWTACHTVWNRLRPSEQEIIMAYHTAPRCGHQTTIDQYAKEKGLYQTAIERCATEKGLSEQYITSVLCKAWRDVSIERGIADQP